MSAKTPSPHDVDGDLPAFADVLRRPLEQLPDPLPMRPIRQAFDASVRPPGSKSLTNRALLLAALAEGESEISGALLDADDAQVMIAALRALGAPIVQGADAGAVDTIRVTGCGGRFRGGCTLFLANAGTATRFLTAAACLADAPVVIDGDPRMRQRPIGELVAMLRFLGVRIEELGEPGCVPLRVHPRRPVGGEIDVATTLSSQFVSAVMMVGSWMRDGLTLRFRGPVTSPSYISMTAGLMRAAGGAGVEGSVESGRLRIGAAPLKGFRYEVEPDASGATYFWAGAALVPGSRCVTPGVTDASLQGDAHFTDILVRAGADAARSNAGATVRGGPTLHALEADMTDTPDAAMTLAALACFADGPTTITGLRTLRVKETDRIAAIRSELQKIGARVDVFADGGDEGMVITPPSGGVDCSPTAARVELATYNDHRMAMSLALIGLRRPNVFVRDPGCVRKTYSRFWRDLAGFYGAACLSDPAPRY